MSAEKNDHLQLPLLECTICLKRIYFPAYLLSCCCILCSSHSSIYPEYYRPLRPTSHLWQTTFDEIFVDGVQQDIKICVPCVENFVQDETGFKSNEIEGFRSSLSERRTARERRQLDDVELYGTAHSEARSCLCDVCRDGKILLFLLVEEEDWISDGFPRHAWVSAPIPATSTPFEAPKGDVESRSSFTNVEDDTEFNVCRESRAEIEHHVLCTSTFYLDCVLALVNYTKDDARPHDTICCRDLTEIKNEHRLINPEEQKGFERGRLHSRAAAVRGNAHALRRNGSENVLLMIQRQMLFRTFHENFDSTVLWGSENRDISVRGEEAAHSVLELPPRNLLSDLEVFCEEFLQHTKFDHQQITTHLRGGGDDDDSNGVCSICQDDELDKFTLAICENGHGMCDDCFPVYIRRESLDVGRWPTCPVCRVVMLTVTIRGREEEMDRFLPDGFFQARLIHPDLIPWNGVDPLDNDGGMQVVEMVWNRDENGNAIDLPRPTEESGSSDGEISEDEERDSDLNDQHASDYVNEAEEITRNDLRISDEEGWISREELRRRRMIRFAELQRQLQLQHGAEAATSRNATEREIKEREENRKDTRTPNSGERNAPEASKEPRPPTSPTPTSSASSTTIRELRRHTEKQPYETPVRTETTRPSQTHSLSEPIHPPLSITQRRGRTPGVPAQAESSHDNTHTEESSSTWLDRVTRDQFEERGKEGAGAQNHIMGFWQEEGWIDGACVQPKKRERSFFSYFGRLRGGAGDTGDLGPGVDDSEDEGLRESVSIVQCGACLDSLEQAARVYPCDHPFHEHCIREWSRSCCTRDLAPSCPICRAVIVAVSLPDGEGGETRVVFDEDEVLDRQLGYTWANDERSASSRMLVEDSEHGEHESEEDENEEQSESQYDSGIDAEAGDQFQVQVLLEINRVRRRHARDRDRDLACTARRFRRDQEREISKIQRRFERDRDYEIEQTLGRLDRDRNRRVFSAAVPRSSRTDIASEVSRIERRFDRDLGRKLVRMQKRFQRDRKHARLRARRRLVKDVAARLPQMMAEF